MITSDNKRLAKNTGLLYIRMLFNLAVMLYTSRVVVAQLGVEDFGIYNVVGGLVTMFTILSNTMTASVSRFLTYDLAKENSVRLQKIFSSSVNIQLILSFIVLIGIETVGVWFLNSEMNIKPERMYAANWVLQCSAFTFVLNMISIPYNASIIAHEKMGAFAYISILETVLKLGVALFLAFKIYDSLIVYAVLTLLVALIIRLIYGFYCSRHFEECHYRPVIEKGVFKEIFSFSGWSFIGAIAGVLRNQGVNILMNIFFGTIINAARALAMIVYNALNGFTTNFMTAINPQIIKSYATGNLNRTNILVLIGSRFSYFLLMVISIPIILRTPQILGLWLTTVPEDTVMFIRLVLALGLSDALSNAFLTANQATGKIKTYQLVIGGLQLLNFPLVYIAYKLGASVLSAYYLEILISQICLFSRVFIVGPTINLNFKEFMKSIYFRVILVSIVAFVPLIYINNIIFSNFWGLLLTTLICVIWSGMVVFILGCSTKEREGVLNYIKKRISHGNK